ncbi:6-phospho-beta-glucosidase [Vibrio genomosp. F10]|uniref:6-phospho-beta-glucosidase n=1 Tax=Vibrio genomosp. F10 TaxID=723171 RepID=UPI0002E5FCA0|nr:6-phospho-beta-glucosidase [Vibrio genomosp. F10]OEF07015.1 6-phospho-beta-glucosidase [Vibrio genomosp. F10 str. 9ZD137]
MKTSLKVVVIGAGSSYTPELIEGLLRRSDSLPIGELWLVDIEESRWKAEIIYDLTKRMAERVGSEMNIILTEDRASALEDADFVCSQFRAGCLESRIRDEGIAAKYGMIAQETNGIVGLANACRTIPIALEIAYEMEELCPDAWLLNFTNPSGMVTEAILQNSSTKTIGLCNVPVNMERGAMELLNAKPEDFFIQIAGLNHLVWARKILHKNQDKMQFIIDEVLAGNDKMRPQNIAQFDWSSALIKDMGMLPCSYLRYFYASEDVLAKLDPKEGENVNRADVVKEIEAKLFEVYRDPDLAVKPKELELRGGQYYSESACRMMNAIHNDTGEIMHVNTLNKGAIQGLPDDCAVEVSAMIKSSGAHPLSVEAFPEDTLRLIQTMKTFESLTIKAAMNGDVKAALRALVMNPLVGTGEKLEIALKETLLQNLNLLPEFKRKDIEILKGDFE